MCGPSLRLSLDRFVASLCHASGNNKQALGCWIYLLLWKCILEVFVVARNLMARSCSATAVVDDHIRGTTVQREALELYGACLCHTYGVILKLLGTLNHHGTILGAEFHCNLTFANHCWLQYQLARIRHCCICTTCAFEPTVARPCTSDFIGNLSCLCISKESPAMCLTGTSQALFQGRQMWLDGTLIGLLTDSSS